MSSVALTFFAFLGFGVITFTAKDLADPARQLPRAVYLALAIATVVYVAVALGVFGTLTVDEVIGPVARRSRWPPSRSSGSAGYWLMSVTALFATAGATNAGLYRRPAVRADGVDRPVPAAARPSASVAARRPACWSPPSRPLVLAVGFDLTLDRLARQRRRAHGVHPRHRGHLRVHRETGARPWLLVVAIATTVIVLDHVRDHHARR